MEYRRLYILVEGNDDERFIERIIKPVLEKRYHSVQIYRYAPQEQFDRLISAKYISRIDFMQEILDNFRIEIAKQNNKSFSYFIKKAVACNLNPAL